MIFNNTKMKAVPALVSLVCLLAAGSASAQQLPPVQITSISVPEYLEYPLGGFTINFTLTGAKYGTLGAGIIGVEFYLSDTPSGSNQVYLLHKTIVRLYGSGYGPYHAPSGVQSLVVSQANMDPTGLAKMQEITSGCQPQGGWYILGYVPQTSLVHDSTTVGRWNQPDHFFTAGALSPATIQPGGTTNLSFTLFKQCPGSNSSRVGIFLADANMQLLSFIGDVYVSGGSGVYSLQPTGITFSPYIPPGTYHIVLIADVDGAITEVNENNNVGAIVLNITSGAQPTLGPDAARMELDVALPASAASAVRGLKPGASDAYLHER